MSEPTKGARQREANERVLGVLAGEDMDLVALSRWARSADMVIAADAGWDRLRAIGRVPDYAIGDFDSVQDREGIEPSRIIIDEHVSHTDCDKLLTLAQSLGVSRLTLASVEGDQIDHMLATLHSASRSPLKIRVALRKGVGWILNAGDRIQVATQPGRRISLVPLEEVRGAILKGVEWKLNGEDLHPSGRTGISNRATDARVEASIQSGAALLFVGFPEEEMPVW